MIRRPSGLLFQWLCYVLYASFELWLVVVSVTNVNLYLVLSKIICLYFPWLYLYFYWLLFSIKTWLYEIGMLIVYVFCLYKFNIFFSVWSHSWSYAYALYKARSRILWKCWFWVNQWLLWWSYFQYFVWWVIREKSRYMPCGERFILLALQPFYIKIHALKTVAFND
jgi:hypothetical protein